MKNNSSELIVLRDMVRDLPFVHELLLNGTISKDDYLEHCNGVLNRVSLYLGTLNELDFAPGGVDAQEAEDAFSSLWVAKRYRNSTSYCGLDFGFYLDPQYPSSVISSSMSGWGVL